jgi:hypothetical protein
MSKQVFKLNKYIEETKKHYHFAEGLFRVNKVPKRKTIEGLGINYSAYRVEKTRDIVKNDNINKLLNFFGYNKVDEEDIIRYEKLFSKVYYCCYYGNEKSYALYLNEIEELMNKRDIFYPILTLFKVFIYYNCFVDYNECKRFLKKELQYLYAFYHTEYFPVDLKYLYLLMLFYFDKLDKDDKESILEIKNFCYKEPKLSWMYYSVKTKKAYLKHEDKEAIMYLEILIKEYDKNKNMNKYLHALGNLAYYYNLEYEYAASLSYTENVIEYLFSTPENKRWIDFVCVHLLYSKLMLNRLDEIIKFFEIFPIDAEKMSDVSAVICLITSLLSENRYFYNKIISMDTKGFVYFEGFLKYIETKDQEYLSFKQNPPYINRLIALVKNIFKDL